MVLFDFVLFCLDVYKSVKLYMWYCITQNRLGLSEKTLRQKLKFRKSLLEKKDKRRKQKKAASRAKEVNVRIDFSIPSYPLSACPWLILG